MSRRLQIVTAVSALALGLVISGCGSTSVGEPNGSAPSPPPAASIRLGLAGPTKQLSACGSTKPFVVSRVGQPVLARGAVVPVPSVGWRVKLKFKRCGAGAWQVVGEQHVKLAADGRFEAILSFPNTGSYTVRAYYYAGARRLRSLKAYASIEP
jgi:hypothetical protein